MNSKYKHGKPIYAVSKKPLLTFSLLAIFLVAGAWYWFVLRQSRSTVKNDTTPIVKTIKATAADTNVDEPDFSFSLPGSWKLSAKDWDARYTSWQWKFQDKRYAGRWFEVFIDTIPADMAYNYLLPVEALGSQLQLGTISGNCVDFTSGASPTSNRPTYTPQFKAVLPSKWQQVNFLCDNANVSHQVVGTGSKEALNSVSLTGPLSGTHKYFFLYSDNNFTPDFTIISTILASFKVK